MDEIKRHEILGFCLIISVSVFSFFVVSVAGIILWPQFTPPLLTEAAKYSYYFQGVLGSTLIWLSIGALFFRQSEWCFHRSNGVILFTRTHRNILGEKSNSYQINDQSKVSVVNVPAIYGGFYWFVPYYATEIKISSSHKPILSEVSSRRENHEKEVEEIKKFLSDSSKKDYRITIGETKLYERNAAKWLALTGILLVISVLLHVPFLTFFFEMIFLTP